ncbi:MAG: hypothetical protein ACE5LB_14620 [Acidiferrobacterales bacterium]
MRLNGLKGTPEWRIKPGMKTLAKLGAGFTLVHLMRRPRHFVLGSVALFYTPALSRTTILGQTGCPAL